MTATIDLDPILALPTPRRIGIVQVLFDNIASELPRPKLSEEFKAELNRRSAEADAHPEQGIPWEEVQAAALARSRDRGDDMTSTIDFDSIFALTVAERIGVVQKILDSIAVDIQPPEMSEEWMAELDRRVAAYRANPSAAVPWEQVKASLLARRKS